MAEAISLEEFRTLTNRVGLELDDEELKHLKPMYEHFLEPIARMNALELDAEDLAVVFSAGWDPEALP